jgi:TPR repeat protein
MENLAATLVFVLLAACSDRSSLGDVQSVTPGDKYVLSVEEIKQLTGPARDGDAKALFRLIQYYTLVDSDLDKRIYWQRIAAEHGNIVPMLNLSLSLGGSGKDCEEALLWIGKVEDSTKSQKWLRSADLNRQSIIETCKAD